MKGSAVLAIALTACVLFEAADSVITARAQANCHQRCKDKRATRGHLTEWTRDGKLLRTCTCYYADGRQNIVNCLNNQGEFIQPFPACPPRNKPEPPKPVVEPPKPVVDPPKPAVQKDCSNPPGMCTLGCKTSKEYDATCGSLTEAANKPAAIPDHYKLCTCILANGNQEEYGFTPN